MLENEVKVLAIDESNFARAQEDPKEKKKFIILPSYMISAAVDKVHIAFIDDSKREVLTFDIYSTESIIETHDDRQIIIARIQDLRLYSLLPEIEDSMIWVRKNHLKNVLQFRTEWRKLIENIVEKKDINDKVVSSRSYILGDIEGFRINLDFRTIYNIQDYLADILGETIILGDKTQHSHFWWKIMRYIDILYVTGIPSEANTYWRKLREIKLFFQQFSYLFDDIMWDLCIADFKLSIGDEFVKVEPIIMNEFKIKREQANDQDNVKWLIKQVRGYLCITEKDKKQ
jgi:hypothetical protein